MGNLKALSDEVARSTVDLRENLKARYKFRLWAGTLKEKELPKLLARPDVTGREVDDLYGQWEHWRKRFDNATLHAINNVATLKANMFKLAIMIERYDPAAKKSGSNMRPGQAEARVQKKKDAEAVLEAARDFVVFIDDDLK